MWLLLSRRDHENDLISDKGKVDLLPLVCLMKPAKTAKENVIDNFVLIEADAPMLFYNDGTLAFSKELAQAGIF